MLNSDHKRKEYAIVYGASNKAALAFSTFLIKKGLHIVLIDKDSEQMKIAEKHI